MMTGSGQDSTRGQLHPLGLWTPSHGAPAFGADELVNATHRVREPIHIVAHPHTGHLGVAAGGQISPGRFDNGEADYLWMATLPPLYPEWLGNRQFCEVHGVRFPYVAGAMARGIASAEMVIEMARAGMLAFLGTAGLSPQRVAHDLDIIEMLDWTQPGIADATATAQHHSQRFHVTTHIITLR